jgi:hypothetical protein
MLCFLFFVCGSAFASRVAFAPVCSLSLSDMCKRQQQSVLSLFLRTTRKKKHTHAINIYRVPRAEAERFCSEAFNREAMRETDMMMMCSLHVSSGQSNLMPTTVVTTTSSPLLLLKKPVLLLAAALRSFKSRCCPRLSAELLCMHPVLRHQWHHHTHQYCCVCQHSKTHKA